MSSFVKVTQLPQYTAAPAAHHQSPVPAGLILVIRLRERQFFPVCGGLFSPDRTWSGPEVKKPPQSADAVQ
uniref:Uncharacterized protein n=1 Tax=Knipowitschia caucasica TaxID=637954 RepID=A0AAV2KTF2_KNICA